MKSVACWTPSEKTIRVMSVPLKVPSKVNSLVPNWIEKGENKKSDIFSLLLSLRFTDQTHRPRYFTLNWLSKSSQPSTKIYWFSECGCIMSESRRSQNSTDQVCVFRYFAGALNAWSSNCICKFSPTFCGHKCQQQTTRLIPTTLLIKLLLTLP